MYLYIDAYLCLPSKKKKKGIHVSLKTKNIDE